MGLCEKKVGQSRRPRFLGPIFAWRAPHMYRAWPLRAQPCTYRFSPHREPPIYKKRIATVSEIKKRKPRAESPLRRLRPRYASPPELLTPHGHRDAVVRRRSHDWPSADKFILPVYFDVSFSKKGPTASAMSGLSAPSRPTPSTVRQCTTLCGRARHETLYRGHWVLFF